jgi:anti-sigma-K factor RskA
VRIPLPERLTNLSDRDLLIMNTEDTKNLLASVNRIDQHLITLNGKVADTMVKVAKAEEITRTAIRKAECAEAADSETNKRIDSWVRATIVASIGAIAAVIAAVLALVRVKI